MTAQSPLLSVEDLHLDFDTFDGALHVLDGVSLALDAGETVGIVGETGCGKSVTVRSILRLLPMPPGRFAGGAIRFKGRDLATASERDMRRIRGLEIALIPQDPMSYLNPVFTVGKQLTDVIRAHGRALPRARRLSEKAARKKAVELLAQVHLPHPEKQLDAYPHELSGGMRQRVLIAMALTGEPSLLIADEPTTALDVTIQAQILRLIGELVGRLGLAVILISHDIGVVAKVCRRIVVMYAGTVVEDATAEDLLARPLHPYTQGLLAAIPRLRGGSARHLSGIPGSIPNLLRPPAGCRFHDRCPLSMDICHTQKPPLIDAGGGQRVACHLYPGPRREARYD
jgi:oligopeptide/dipeptide ABC transporter ATP-binding protein